MTLPKLQAAGLDAWCPRCREVVPTIHTGECSWCSAQTGGNTTLLPHDADRRRFPVKLTEAVMQEARRRYLAGEGMGAVARALHCQTTYSDAHCMSLGLYREFGRRGWARRDPRDVAAAKSTHGLSHDHAAYQRWWKRDRGIVGPRCAATKRNGARCRAHVHAGSEFCVAHDPTRRERNLAHIESMRARRAVAA